MADAIVARQPGQEQGGQGRARAVRAARRSRGHSKERRETQAVSHTTRSFLAFALAAWAAGTGHHSRALPSVRAREREGAKKFWVLIRPFHRCHDGVASYDFFYKNGVPVWRGTGYYYSRFRPGLGVSGRSRVRFENGSANAGLRRTRPYFHSWS